MKNKLLHFLRVLLLLFAFTAVSTSAWAAATVTIYFDNSVTQWPENSIYLYMGHGSYSRSDWQMTKVSDYLYKCEGVAYWGDATQIAFAQSQWGGEGNSLTNRLPWQGDYKYTKPYDIDRNDATAYVYTATANGTTYTLSRVKYSEYTPPTPPTPSVVLPTQKGACSKIEIYSKDNVNLYVFDSNAHVGPEWGNTDKGEQVSYNGSTYYKWTICNVNDVQIIFQNGDRSKQSGNSPKLYGGYAYFFDGQYVSDARPVPNPTAVEEVDCDAEATCYNTPTADNIPTEKGACSKIEIYSKDNVNLYVFSGDAHVGHSWTDTQKGEEVTYGGSTYYKWTICEVDEVQIIFQNGDRSKQSGNSPKLYGGYAYFFDGQYVSDARPVPTPTTVEDVDCSTSGTCYNASSIDEDKDVPELPDGLECNSTYRDTLFFEDFGTLTGEKSRKRNNTVDDKYSKYCGTSDEFVTSYNFVNECVNIRNAGEYAIVTNPKWSGCTSLSDNVDYGNTCDCDASVARLWYKDCTDHTGNANGGMLQFDCRDGNSKDILYQRTLKNVCKNTFLNFSVWITKANTSEADPIKVRFILRRGGADGEPIGKKDIDNIDVNDGWVHIFAMFNTGELNAEGEITVQVINLAKYGQFGNDLLLDDLELSACLPLAKLVCSDGVSVEKTIDLGETEVLTASIENGILENPYYYWQYKTARSLWQPFFDEVNQTALAPTQGLDKMQVKPEESSVQYRVIIANSAEEAIAIATEREFSGTCGMAAITNEVLINTIKNDLQLTASIADGDICVDGVDANTLTLTLKNPRIVDATDVKVSLVNIDNLNITKVSGTGTYSSGVWTVGTLTADATASIVLKITSNTSVAAVMSRVIGAFVSEVDVETYASYENAPTESKKQTTLKLNPVPAAPTVTAYDQCAKSGNVALSTLASGSNLKFYSDAALTNEVTAFSASTVVTDKKYYVTQTNASGCTSAAAPISVTVKQNPTLNSVLLDKTAICATDANSKAVLTYNISGGLAPYTLYIDRTEAGETQVVNPSNLSATGTYSLKPSSDATYKFTKVVDANGCESTSTKTLFVDVQEIKVTTNISDERVCADKNLVYTVNATGDNLNYKWFESTNNGSTFRQVGTNSATYTTGSFAMGDQKQYKVEVYQDPEVCGFVEGLSKVTVNDCSGFELDYSAETSATICKNGNITLKVSLKNNGNEAVNAVEVKITNISNQTLVSRTPSVGSYDHPTGIWTIPSLAKDATATLTIKIKGVTVVTNLESKAYVVKSGSTTYTEATTKALAIEEITVKDITAAPTLIANTYEACPEVGMLNLNTQVSSDATSLKFYTTETGSATATQANKNSIGTTSYWVSNTEDGKCESERTKLDIVVFPKPTASLSGSTTICKGGSADLNIQLTGKANYIITLSNGDVQRGVSANTAQMTVSPEVTTTYTIRSVIDGNGCEATTSGSAKVTVNEKPVIEFTENPLPEYCAGVEYTLPTPTVDNKGAIITESGWYLAGVKLTNNKIKFTTEDNAKSLVYKAKNTCGETTATFVASLNVADCADIILNYSLDKRDYCAGDEAVLTATIKNNGETALSNVKLYQTWSGKQTTISSSKDKGTYENNVWTLTSLAKGESATLIIKFTANESEEFKMHVTTANGVTYSSYDASVANGFAELVVKEISDNVVARDYIACPTEGQEFPITELVASNKDGLKVMGKNDAGEYYDLTSVPMVNPSVQTASTTYYITNIENGKCESTTPTPVTVEVYKPVSASISAPKEVCYGNNSAVEISLDGVAPYVVVYNNGTSDVTLDNITTSTVTINDALYTTTTYSLVSVTDKNGCEAPISSGDKAIITVNELPTIASVEIEDDDDYICQGTTTNLIVTFTGNAPFTFTINGTQYTSDDNEFEMEISQAGRYVVENLVDAKCSSAADSQASATLYVEAIPELTVSPTSAKLDCNNEETTITASGAFTYSWTDNKGTAAQSGASILAKQTGSETIYTVVGTSEHGCVSEPVSVTVTENFVAPTVEMTTYNYGEEVDLEKDLILTCNHYAVTLKADTENSPVDIASYKWSTGAEGETYSLLIADAAGIYSVEVTGVNGCKATGNIEVKENFTLPDITLKSYRHNKDVESTILTCSYPALDLKATINNPEEIGVEEVYLYWEIDGRDMSGSNPLTVYAPGEYKVYIQGDNYCKNSATINITEDTEHPELKLTASSDKITCDITEVELTVESNIKEVDYDWISWNREDGQGDGISNTSVAKVEKGGDYEVIVTVSATGCANSKRITIEEYTDLPVVEITPSEEKVTCKPNTLTASGAKTYTWSTEEAKDAIEVTTGGTYTVYGKNEYGCVGEAEITLEEDKLAPSIKLTADTTWVTCRREKAVLTAEVTNAEDTRTYSYAWAQNNVVSNVTKSTFDAKVEATYKVTITDETNACKAEKTINIKENKQNPLIDIKSLPSVCLPATVDLKDAVGPNTKADEVKYFADATLTQQLTDTNIEAAANAVYYVVGYEIDNNGCVGDPIAIPVVLKPSTSKPVVENYDECAEVGTKTLSSLVKSDKTKLVFFEDETSEAPIADLFSTSAENTTTTYWVSNTKTGACESERAAIEVNIAGYIDFSVEASQTRLPAGQEVTITVTPLSDTPVDEYVWYRGDEVVQATDELELTEQLYLNEKYSVQAVGRCNSPKKEVDVEAIWPTAFTPHNGNGKNDSFADGMNIIVFNRFYTKIYEGPDGWDGSINGAMNDGKETAVPGVYYYSVLLPNGQVKKGTIEIIKVD